MNTKKFAVVGCEHAHIDIFIQEMLAAGHVCAGIWEPNNTGLAGTIAARRHIPLVDDRDRLLREADIVGCSAINSEKIDLIELCERLGKPIMVDKPAATNRRDCERLQAVIDRGAIAVGMLLTERFNPAVYTLKRLIEQGSLGKLLTVGMRKPHRLNPDARPAWFFSKEQCGGILIDLLVHDYDLLRWFTGGEVVRSSGYMTKRILPEHPGFYDSASVQVLMEGDVTAQLYTDWFTPSQSWTWGDGRIFATGTEGFAELRLSGDPFVKGGPLLLLTTNSDAPAIVELERPAGTITGDFLRRIDNQPSVLTGNDIARATQATIEADEQVTLIRTKAGEA